MAVRKIKGSWWVDFQVRHERVRRRSPLNTKAGALEFELELRGLCVRHHSTDKALLAPEPPPLKEPVTLREFAERWFCDYATVNNKPSEQRNKRSALDVHLLPALGHLPLSAIGGHPVEQLKAELLRKGLSAKTINNFLTILRKCLDTAVEWGELTVVPRIRHLKALPPPFRFISSEEVETLLAYSFEEDWRVLILAAVRTGMRFGELSALHWNDIDFERRMIHVHRSRYLGIESAPKNHRSRHIPLAADLAEALRPRRGPDDTHAFQHQGKPIAWTTAMWKLKRICVAAGLKPFSWHVLRHTFASELALRGATLQAIRELLGHATIQMTLRYAHLTTQALHDTVALLCPNPLPQKEMSTWRQPELVKPSEGPVPHMDSSRFYGST